MNSWYELLDEALEGLVPAEENGTIPWSWRLDAILNGLTLQALTSEAALDRERIRDEVIRTLFPDGLSEGPLAGAGNGVPVSG